MPVPRTSDDARSVRLAALSITGAFITYFSMYAFRKPFSAAEYGDLTLWGLDYKIVLVIAQVAGYTMSKFLGIKVVSELEPAARIRSILGLIGVAWLALLLFGLIPHPYNWWCLLLNGLPLGMIWGMVFAFLEGRRQTELLAAGLASSFIVASGFVKSVGAGFVLNGFLGLTGPVSDFWMPFLTGLVFIPSLLLGIWLLSKVPPPSTEDEAHRGRRQPMTRRERSALVASFAPGIVLTTIIYMALNAYRDVRDNFAVELWHALGYAEAPQIMTISEIPIAVAVLVIAAAMILVRRNRLAFQLNLWGIVLGGVIVLATTALFRTGGMSAAAWMVAVGFGMYLPYMLFNTVLFERWIAAFRSTANVGFLIYVCDSFGYLASVAVMLTKEFAAPDLSWLDFFVRISLGTGGLIIALGLITIAYFARRAGRVGDGPHRAESVS